MPVKKLQLRGISRTPSDRMTEDGGVAESLNIMIDQTEAAPVLMPKDITAEKGLPVGKEYDILFEHKGNGYDNFICQTHDSLPTLLLEGNSTELAKEHIAIEVADKYVALMKEKLNQDIGKAARNSLINSLMLKIYPITLPGIFPSIEDSQSVCREWVESFWYDMRCQYGFTAGIGIWKEGKFYPFFVPEENEIFKNIIAVGNTLVIGTNLHTRYILYKDGKYINLGTTIPKPKFKVITDDQVEYNKQMRFAPGSNDLIEVNYIKSIKGAGYTYGELEYANEMEEQAWGKLEYKRENERIPLDSLNSLYWPDFNSTYLDPTIFINDSERAFLEFIKDTIDLQDRSNSQKGIFSYPIWFTAGIKLYDDSYYADTPILLHPSNDYPYEIGFAGGFRRGRPLLTHTNELDYYEGDKVFEEARITIERKHAYKVLVEIELPDNWKLWSDIITSVNFGTSNPIGQSLCSSFTAKVEAVMLDKYPYLYHTIGYGTIYPMPRDYSFKDECEDALRNIHLIESIPYLDVKQGTKEIDSINKTLTDEISALPYLDNFIFDEVYRFGSLQNLNNRVIGYDITKVINPHVIANAITYRTDLAPAIFAKPIVSLIDDWELHIIYSEREITFSPDAPANKVVGKYAYIHDLIIKDENELKTTDSFTVNGKKYLSVASQVISIGGYDTKEVCFYGEGANSANINLTRHFLGGSPVSVSCESVEPLINILNQSLPLPQATDNKEEVVDYIYLSDIDSPFFFPIKNRYRLYGTILGTGAITKPLSQGQFGQFPLYVFTDGGIYAMEMNAEGTFSSQHMVSREIALPGTILSMEQGIIFSTTKGVMMLTGSDVIPLSPNMNGKHYVAEEDLTRILGSHPEWKRYANLLSDTTNFMECIKQAAPIYDYNGDRLIFPSEKMKDYQYVYKKDTKTWHKLSVLFDAAGSPIPIKRSLNSYPNAYAQVDDENGTHLYDFSTVLDVNDETPSKGIIITRPFDLGEPDVRKAIKHIKIRGNFNPGDVKYLLLGSNDGINFRFLPSLRGGSYKLFRLALMCDLQPTERISWIDIDYETRFTNTLR